MSATIASTPRPIREPRNGVNTPVLLATINAVKETPALAKFQFRASCRWVDGTYSESRVESFTGAGAEHTHQTQFRYAADHPAVLVGLVGAERADVDPILAAGREADGALPHQERAVAHRALAVDVLSPDDQDAFASSRSF